MRRKDLIELIEQGENLQVEFKQRFSSHEKIAREIIAFANTSGGYILFGVDDDKKLYGVASEKGEAELIKETIENYCEPLVKYSLEYIEVEGKEIVVLHIPESETKPHRLQDYLNLLDINKAQVFVRVNDKSILASKEMIRIMKANSAEAELKKYTIGINEKIVFSYLENNDSIDVKTLSKIANISGRRASRTLVKLVRANLLYIHTRDNGEEFFSART